MADPVRFNSHLRTIFSALFCKLWRLNKLLASAKRFKRIQIQAKDVLYPFAILLMLNFTLLSVWTAVDPLRWVRHDLGSFDMYGRVTETSGSCASESPTNEAIFYTFFVLFNASALIIANWQSYLGRNHKTEFNESGNIAISMLFLTEAAVLGFPVLFLVANDPGAYFLVRAILIVIISVGVLIPIFLPKVSLRNKMKHSVRRMLNSSSSRMDDSSAGLDASRGNASSQMLDAASPSKSEIVPSGKSWRSESGRSAHSTGAADDSQSSIHVGGDDEGTFEVRELPTRRRVSFLMDESGNSLSM